MLFITNRVLKQGPTPVKTDGAYALPRAIDFELTNNQAEQSIYFCRRHSAGKYTEIGGQTFFSLLKQSKFKQVLLYIHGFSNLPEPTIFDRAGELQNLFDQIWPEGIVVVPLIWPCDNDMGVVKDYFDDQIAADASAFAFARLFEKFISWREKNSTVQNPCTKWINIFAHSMGNRVLRGTLKTVVDYYQPKGIPLVFRNIFMASADTINDSLEPGKEAEYISYAARNVVVYYAADDLAMRASKVANMTVASRRLGHTGPANMNNVAKNVYALDCDDFNNSYDRPVGHGYFARDPQGNPGLLFRHMWQCLDTGRVPMGAKDSRRDILTQDLLD